jgi:hypothetical protein
VHGSDFSDLGEFVNIDHLHGMVIPYCDEIKLDHLKLIPNLKLVVIGVTNDTVDLSDMAQLQDVTVHWSRGLRLPQVVSTIKRLSLYDFKPPSKSVMPIFDSDRARLAMRCSIDAGWRAVWKDGRRNVDANSEGVLPFPFA